MIKTSFFVSFDGPNYTPIKDSLSSAVRINYKRIKKTSDE